MQKDIHMSKQSEDKAITIISNHGGIVNTHTAIDLGIQPRTLYNLRDKGELTLISRGIYRITSLPKISNPDLTTVALRCPKAVLCLISALSFHEITTQIPHTIHIALQKGAEQPRIDYPPLTVYRFSNKSYQSGIDFHEIDNIPISVYSPEKTIIDCFKFRNKIGIDIFIEALKLYRQNTVFNLDALLKYAKICRVFSGIKPYLEITI